MYSIFDNKEESWSFAVETNTYKGLAWYGSASNSFSITVSDDGKEVFTFACNNEGVSFIIIYIMIIIL